MDGRHNNGGLRSPAGGRPRWMHGPGIPEQVRKLAAKGMSQDTIAKAIGVSEATLKRNFPSQLQLGHLTYRAEVARVAYEMAVSGNYPAVTRYWLRRFAGW